MKKLIFICVILIGIATSGFAQTAAAATEKAKGLQKELVLNSAQTAKISTIYKESAEKFEKIKVQEHGDNAKLTVAIRPLRVQTVSKIKAVLTPAQSIKYDKLLKSPGSQGAGWGEGWASPN